MVPTETQSMLLLLTGKTVSAVPIIAREEHLGSSISTRKIVPLSVAICPGSDKDRPIHAAIHGGMDVDIVGAINIHMVSDLHIDCCASIEAFPGEYSSVCESCQKLEYCERKVGPCHEIGRSVVVD